MRIWLDAQLSPALAAWIGRELGDECRAVRELGLREALDREIFEAARAAESVVITKDSDFAELVERLGPRRK